MKRHQRDVENAIATVMALPTMAWDKLSASQQLQDGEGNGPQEGECSEGGPGLVRGRNNSESSYDDVSYMTAQPMEAMDSQIGSGSNEDGHVSPCHGNNVPRSPVEDIPHSLSNTAARCPGDNDDNAPQCHGDDGSQYHDDNAAQYRGDDGSQCHDDNSTQYRGDNAPQYPDDNTLQYHGNDAPQCHDDDTSGESVSGSQESVVPCSSSQCTTVECEDKDEQVREI